MAWFYYSGNVPRSITVKKGLSVSMKPHGKVEIFDVNLPEVRAMRKKGKLRLTSKPKDAKSIKDVPATTGDDIKKKVEKSKLAQFVAEKGVTSKKGGQPKSKNPELTIGERTSASKNDKGDKDVSEKKNDKSSPPEIADKSDDANVEELSNADSGPNEDGDKKKSKKGRGRKG